MNLAKIIGTVVSTVKCKDYEGYKILVAQPLDPDGNPKGRALLALDAIQAGVGDTVLLVDEGGSAKMVLDIPEVNTIRTVVFGIVDEVSKEL